MQMHKSVDPGGAKPMASMDDRSAPICEICGEVAEFLCGCNECGRMYGPCCNSIEDSICVECI